MLSINIYALKKIYIYFIIRNNFENRYRNNIIRIKYFRLKNFGIKNSFIKIKKNKKNYNNNIIIIYYKY